MRRMFIVAQLAAICILGTSAIAGTAFSVAAANDPNFKLGILTLLKNPGVIFRPGIWSPWLAVAAVVLIALEVGAVKLLLYLRRKRLRGFEVSGEKK